MLILSRGVDQKVIIQLPDGREVEIMVTDIKGDRCKLGFTAPTDIPIHRQEVLDSIKQNGPRKKLPSQDSPGTSGTR